MSVMDDTADLSELRGHCRVLQLISKTFDSLLGILAAADLVTERPADHEAEAGEQQHP